MAYSEQDMERAKELLQSYWDINKRLVKLSQTNAASLGITLQQMAILNTLFLKPDVSLKELAERLSTPKSTISVNIDGLVQSGLVERQASPESRREVRLNITEKGKEHAKKSIENATSYKAMANIVNQMPEKAVQELLDLNHGMISRLNETMPDK